MFSLLCSCFITSSHKNKSHQQSFCALQSSAKWAPSHQLLPYYCALNGQTNDNYTGISRSVHINPLVPMPCFICTSLYNQSIIVFRHYKFTGVLKYQHFQQIPQPEWSTFAFCVYVCGTYSFWEISHSWRKLAYVDMRPSHWW